MRKILLSAILAAFVLTSLNAQGEFRAGASLGLPVGDIADVTTFAFGIDLSYLFEVADQLSVGPTAGYQHFFGDNIDVGSIEVEVEDFSFMKIAGEGNYNVTENFDFIGELGYAVGLKDGEDGGIFFRAGFDWGFWEDLSGGFSYSQISRDINAGLFNFDLRWSF